MRWLVLCTLVLCIASSAWAVDTGNKYIAPAKQDVTGDGASDGREGGETYADALVIPAVPYSDTGATCDNRDDILPSCGYSVAYDVVYAWTPAADIVVNIDLCGSSYDTIMEIQDGIGVPVACNDDFCGVQSGFEFFQAYAGHTYYIIVDGYSSGCGSYVLNITVPTPCVLECPDGGLLEGEPDCYDGYYDAYNGGCNSTGWTYICPQPGATTVMCGKSGTYLYNGWTYRDTDWFSVMGAGGLMTFSCQAEFPLQMILIYGLDCSYLSYTYTTADRCVWGVLAYNLAFQQEAWLWVGASTFSGVPCGSDYYMEVTGIWCEQVPTEPESWGEIKGLFR